METEETVKWLLKCNVLKFGDFTLKSGRKSRYFFNLGEIYNGDNLEEMSMCYLNEINHKIPCVDVVYGPTYKGIPIAMSIVNQSVMDLSYCFNRKEEKDHGDGGKLVGAPLENQGVVVVDDVITSGFSILESALVVQRKGGNLSGVVVFIDRMEPVDSKTVNLAKEYLGVDNMLVTEKTAAEFLRVVLGVPVISVLTIKDIVGTEYAQSEYTEECAAITAALKLK